MSNFLASSVPSPAARAYTAAAVATGTDGVPEDTAIFSLKYASRARPRACMKPRYSDNTANVSVSQDNSPFTALLNSLE